jgi:hypothetical protein
VRSQWQVFVAVFSDHGGIICPCQPDEPTGFWLGLPATDAAIAVSDGEWVRLSDEHQPDGIRA